MIALGITSKFKVACKATNIIVNKILLIAIKRNTMLQNVVYLPYCRCNHTADTFDILPPATVLHKYLYILNCHLSQKVCLLM